MELRCDPDLAHLLGRAGVPAVAASPDGLRPGVPRQDPRRARGAGPRRRARPHRALRLAPHRGDPHAGPRERAAVRARGDRERRDGRTRPRGSTTAASSGSAPRSASPPRSSTRSGPWGSPSSRPRSTWSRATGTCGVREAHGDEEGEGEGTGAEDGEGREAGRREAGRREQGGRRRAAPRARRGGTRPRATAGGPRGARGRRRGSSLRRRRSPPGRSRSPRRCPRPRTSARRPTALAIANAALDKKAEDVLVLDVRGLASYADYFVLMTADSDRQASAIADHVEATMKDPGADQGRRPRATRRAAGSSWTTATCSLTS